jgi:hypothetical protein
MTIASDIDGDKLALSPEEMRRRVVENRRSLAAEVAAGTESTFFAMTVQPKETLVQIPSTKLLCPYGASY